MVHRQMVSIVLMGGASVVLAASQELESDAHFCCCYGGGDSKIAECGSDGRCNNGIYGKFCDSAEEVAPGTLEADHCCCFGTGWCDSTGYCAGIHGDTCPSAQVGDSTHTELELAEPVNQEPIIEAKSVAVVPPASHALESEAHFCCCYGGGDSKIAECGSDGRCNNGIYGKFCDSAEEVAPGTLEADHCCCFGTGWCDSTGYCAGIYGDTCPSAKVEDSIQTELELAEPVRDEPHVKAQSAQELESEAHFCCCYGGGDRKIAECGSDGRCNNGIYGKFCDADEDSASGILEADHCCCFGTGWCDSTGYCSGIYGDTCPSEQVEV